MSALSRPSSRTFLHALAVALVASVLAAVLVVGGSSLASANDSCDLVQRPASSLTIDDDSAGSYMVGFALDSAGEEAVEQVRVLARFALAGHRADTLARVMDYLDSIIAWYRYQERPCAPALPYPGPFTERPEIPAAPFGFGGVNVDVAPEFTIVVNGEEPATEPAPAAAAEAAAAPDDGPGLAVSGSESFVLAYFGVGLLAFGATALGMRRWVATPSDET